MATARKTGSQKQRQTRHHRKLQRLFETLEACIKATDAFGSSPVEDGVDHENDGYDRMEWEFLEENALGLLYNLRLARQTLLCDAPNHCLSRAEQKRRNARYGKIENRQASATQAAG